MSKFVVLLLCVVYCQHIIAIPVMAFRTSGKMSSRVVTTSSKTVIDDVETDDIAQLVQMTEEAVQYFLTKINAETSKMTNQIIIAYWNYESNITDETRAAMLNETKANAIFTKKLWDEVIKWESIYDALEDEKLARQLAIYSFLGTAALTEEKNAKLTEISTEMSEIYNTGKICDWSSNTTCNLTLDGEINDILTNSRDYDELLHVWLKWRDNVGKPIRKFYPEYVELQNEVAQLNGYESAAEMWLDQYETASFENDMADLIEQLKPLYEQLHAYVRRKLRELYGEEKIPIKKAIPAHLLGNMWAQSWGNLYSILVPYPDRKPVDVTEALKKKGYTPRLMFEEANNFFLSLNLSSVPESFWENSIITRPEGRDLTCHASAWDFMDGKDVRIKQCTEVNQEDFFVVHHEMGHIQYYIQYKDLPLPFRAGANGGFHEAIGDVLSLSVSTPKHLYKLGLLDSDPTSSESSENYENDINFLMRSALEKIAFLPFAYLVDKWRWDVFRGKVVPSNYTESWWKDRFNLQGIVNPVLRTEEDFDPASKYHVAASVQYSIYFVANILQFQMHKALCRLADEYDPEDASKPMHQCDIHNSTKAGNALGDMLKLGASQHWSKTLKLLTGTTEMDAAPLREYFAPLESWLKADNIAHDEFVGWEGESTTPVSKLVGNDNQEEEIDQLTLITEDATQMFLNKVNAESSKRAAQLNLAYWNYDSNIKRDTRETMINNIKVNAMYKKNRRNEVLKWRSIYGALKNETINRQLKSYAVLGPSALPEEKNAKFSEISTEMIEIYNTGKICAWRSNTNCKLSLDRDLSKILRTSRNYDELAHVWLEWRDTVGKPIRKLFPQYVELLNEAAQLNEFESATEMWLDKYESPTFEDDMADLIEQLKPLYEQLHAYVRRKLREVYGEEKIPKRKAIPAHLLGNMWAQKWNNLYPIVVPYPDRELLNVTEAMIKKGYTPRLMFEEANRFFLSLNLSSVPESFWENSIFTKLKDRKIACHASSWDFMDGEDVRIKQCTEVTQNDFYIVHHEMGHIQYYMQYKDLPLPLRDGANAGFHEAVGDVLLLSVSTPKHLYKLGLLDSDPTSSESSEKYENDINFLMRLALGKIPFLPFAYVVDKWRWDVFREKVVPSNYSCTWWNDRHQMQGIVPPVSRTEEDFDPASKYHVAASVQYSNYFVSNILQFQMHKALCLLADEYDPEDSSKPMHQCDIHNSTKAGNALGDMLKLGSSQHWSKTLESLTGTTEMDATPLREYFAPLESWLKADNIDHDEFVGWEGDENFC